jgi:hypothetical protein
MAEVTGLAIGGVALASLFDACMRTFERIDAGKNCGRDYQEAALKITLLGNRLSRWEDLYRTTAPSSTIREGYLAEAALESINSSLDRLCKTTDRYQPSDGSAGVANTTEKLQTMTISRVKTSLGSKIIWALHDKKEVNEVILSVRFKIEELESLASTLVPAIKQRAESEAEELILPAYVEEPEKTMQVLRESTVDVDPYFGDGVAKVTGHYFENVVAVGNAKAHTGDFVAEGYTGEFTRSHHSYKNVRAEGNAIVHVGNMYGKSIFD